MTKRPSAAQASWLWRMEFWLDHEDRARYARTARSCEDRGWAQWVSGTGWLLTDEGRAIAMAEAKRRAA